MGRLNRSIIVINRTKIHTVAVGIWQLAFCQLVILFWVTTGCEKTVRQMRIRPEGDPNQPVISTYEQACNLYQKVLNRYVRKDGRIDYQKMAEDTEDRSRLDGFLSFVAEFELEQSPVVNDEKSRQAFYLNVYNACSLRGGLEFYPQGKIPDEYDTDLVFTVAGQEMSLHQMAEQMTVQTDWRISLALSRPALSGPYLAKTIYRDDKLGAQLDQALKDYLGSCAGCQIDFAKQQVLLGGLIYDRKEEFLQEYKRRYGIEGESLVSALIPYAWPATQVQMAEAAGFAVGRLPSDNRINDIEREDLQEDDSQEEYRICGCQ